MDEISLLVSETYRHYHQHFSDKVFDLIEEELQPEAPSLTQDLPSRPGLLYHLQKSTSVFVIRTHVSSNLREDYLKVLENPGDYPSLRLVSDGEIHTDQLKFFILESRSQAEIIHDQLSNRRFPIFEERMCNLSDPGFSWWMQPAAGSFQIAFNLSLQQSDDVVKLGPLGDQQLAIKTFLALGDLLESSGLPLSVQNEVNRIQFTETEPMLLEEFRDLFELGVVGEGIIKLFTLLSRKHEDSTLLETTWLYLQELASVRRFWIQVQYDLSV